MVLPLFDTAGRAVELLGYPLEGGPPRRAGVPGGVFNAAAMKVHAEITLYGDPLRALAAIARGIENAVATGPDEWTDLTDGIFRDLAPHRVHLEEGRVDKGLLKHLKEIGMRTGEDPEPAAAESAVEGGFSASFGKRRYVIQAITQENPRHLRALVRAVGQTAGRFHLDELVHEEWVLDRGGKPRQFELVWDGREGKVLLGLRSIEEILEAVREIPGDSGVFRPVPK